MSNLQDWKDKCKALIEKVTNKEVVTTMALVALMGSAFYFMRRMHLNKSPAELHLHYIQSNIQKITENNESLSTLVIEKEQTLEKNNITMVYNLISKLNQKQKGTKEAIRNPFLPPFQEGLYVQDLGPNHRLLLNKYNIYRGHLLVTTKQFAPQDQPLQREDIKQTVYAFKANRGFYFFNSGPRAGASQKHRHIQIFPNEARELPLFRSILQYVRSRKTNVQDFKIIQYPPFNFAHGLIIIGSAGMYSQSEHAESKQERMSRMQGRLAALKERSYRAYEKLHKQFIGDRDIDYNLVGCQDFLLLVPRSQEKAFDELGVNAVGFMGSVLFKSKEMWLKFIKEDRHGYQILEDITYPKSFKR